MKLAITILKKMIGSLALVLFCGLVIMVLSSKASGGEPIFFQHQLKAVLSGSMEPTFKTGSIILIKNVKETASLKKSDVITFRSQDKLITHRIVDTKKSHGKTLYITKGDNNDGPDPDYVLPENVVGRYTNITIPYTGYLMNYANSKAGSALLLIIPGLLLVLSSARSVFKAFKEKEMEMKNA